MSASSRVTVRTCALRRVLPHALAAGLWCMAVVIFGVGNQPWLMLALHWVLWLTLVESRLWRRLPSRPAAASGRWLPLGAGLLLLGSAIADWFAVSPRWLVAQAAPAVLLGVVLRTLLRAGLRTDHRSIPELTRLALLLLGCLWLIQPYATSRLVGAGDAEHYVRQLADFITQARWQALPTFVGQSLPSFNGSIHPLRVAPYFQHAGALLDLLTGRGLTPVAVQNLLVCLSLLAAMLGGYAALARAAGRGRRWEALWLALLYGSSPGILALLYGGDMLASWMTLPWLPWLFLGWVLAWREPASFTGLLLQAVSLAGLWLAHAPIALWATLLTILAELARMAASRDRWRVFLLQFAAAGLCLLLCQYVFVSVAMLEVPDNPYLGFDLARGAIFASVQESWSGLFRFVSPGGDQLAHDLHLSPGLLAVAGLGGVAAARVRGAAVALVAAIGLLVVLVLPWQGVTGRIWAAMPVVVMTVLEKWPVQRIYPLLSALIPVLGAVALAHPRAAGPHARQRLLLLLAAAAAWSAWEARKFVAHGYAVTRSEGATTRFLLPENNTLSRYSYEMWGYLPEFFSFGYMDPETQNRLIDPVTGEVRTSNTRALQARASEGARHQFVATADGGRLEPAVVIPPGEARFVSFEFHGRPEGTLLVEGLRLERRYALPASGGANAFGALPGQNRGFLLRNFGTATEEVRIRFASRTPGGITPASARVVPYDKSQLPFRLISLLPFELEAATATGGWVETPKLLVPGYQVRVNGLPAECRRSPNGLVMTRVPPGTVRIRIDYVAPGPLLGSYILTALAWLALASVAVARSMLPTLLGARAHRPAIRPDVNVGWHLLRPGRSIPSLITLVTLVLLPMLALQTDSIVVPASQEGYHLRVKFPVGRHENYETLFSWRDFAGATTSIVVFYENDRFIRLGCRKNGILKVLTDPLPVSYFVPNDLSINREPASRTREPADHQPASVITDAVSVLRIRFNHHLVLETDYTHQSDEVATLSVGHEISPNIPGAYPFSGKLLASHGRLGQPRAIAAATDLVALQQ